MSFADGKEEETVTSISFQPIGIIHSPFREAEGTPIQPVFASDAPGTIELYPAFSEGLHDLAGFERIWILYHLHRSPEMRLKVKPFLDSVAHGIFATRSPARPNPIGISCVGLRSIDGNRLSITGVDVIDGTPLIDIKPYVPRFDSFPESRAGWFTSASGGITLADKRFTTKGEPA